MIHRTFRSLDDPPKLVGFTIRQWGALIATSAVVLATVRLAHLPGKPAITLATFAVGLPAALTYVSESGGLHLGTLLADVVRWRLARKTLCAFSDAARPLRGVLVLEGDSGEQTESPAPTSRGTRASDGGAR